MQGKDGEPQSWSSFADQVRDDPFPQLEHELAIDAMVAEFARNLNRTLTHAPGRFWQQMYADQA